MDLGTHGYCYIHTGASSNAHQQVQSPKSYFSPCATQHSDLRSLGSEEENALYPEGALQEYTHV